MVSIGKPADNFESFRDLKKIDRIKQGHRKRCFLVLPSISGSIGNDKSAVAGKDVDNKTQNKDLFMVTTTIKLYYAQKKRSIYNFI